MSPKVGIMPPLLRPSSASNILLLFSIAIGTFLPCWQFGSNPAGLNVDEAQIGVEAAALLMTGMDRWGQKYPMYFSAWGSGLNSLYAYLSLPFISLLGLNVWSIRLVSLLHGLLLLPLTYITVSQVFSKRVGLIATALVATLPWQVMASRWGLESNILPFWFLLGVLTVHIGLTSSSAMTRILALVPWSLAIYAYSIFIFTLIPLVTLFVILNIRKILSKKFSWIAGGCVSLLIALPMLLFMSKNALNMNIDWIEELLPISIPLFPSLRTDAAGFLSIWSILYNGIFILSGLSDSAQEHQHILQPITPLLPFFSLVGLAYLAYNSQKYKNIDVITLAFISSSVPFILVHVNTVRINGFILMCVVLSAVGLSKIYTSICDKRLRILTSCITVAFFAFYVTFSHILYFKYYNDDILNSSFHPGLLDTLRAAEAAAAGNEDILLVEESELPYIYVLFSHPELIPLFQSSVQPTVTSSGTYRVDRFGRYAFFDRAVIRGESAPTELTPSYVFAAPTEFTPCENYTALWNERGWVAGECHPNQLPFSPSPNPVR